MRWLGMFDRWNVEASHGGRRPGVWLPFGTQCQKNVSKQHTFLATCANNNQVPAASGVPPGSTMGPLQVSTVACRLQVEVGCGDIVHRCYIIKRYSWSGDVTS